MTAHMLRGLYAITPDWSDTARLLATTEVILAGDCRLLQYRNKTASPSLRLTQAEALRSLTARHKVPLLINDDPELALRCAADGVHLGREDGALAAARSLLGDAALLGASCYNEAVLAEKAIAAGADYIAFGAMFPSSTKPAAVRAPLSLIAAARKLGRPIACIGGITADNAAPLITAGADLLAVITDLFDAPDPHARAKQFSALFHTEPEPENHD
ncbi:MAG: thiamine phosphate synthase [Betaproteobacteria bacterium]|nr:thiamine phosphate synthase [Betaproteobacteria bacterium]